MTDIADIGFKADTSDLDKAVLVLDKLSNASKGVATSTNKAAQSVQSSGKLMAQAAADTARAVSLRAKADLDALRLSKSSSKADIMKAETALKAARAEESYARSLLAVAKASLSVEKAVNSATAAQVRQTGVASRFNAVSSGRGVTAAATGVRIGSTGDNPIANDQMPNRFNTANIAAQFQDIGVTAAMGMNPLTVALQQGTQISAILNSMESPLKGLAQAFKSVINPVSLMAIAFTGVAVALIQFVDWGVVARTMLNGLADAIDAAAPYVLSLAAALAILYSPAILSGLTALTIRIAATGSTALIAGAKMAAAWVIGMGPVAWVAVGIATVLAALFVFRDALGNLLGFDVLNALKTGVNTLIGVFVGGFNGIKATWGLLPGAIGDIIISTANNVLGGIERMIMGVVERLNKFLSKFGIDEIKLALDGQGNLENQFAGQAAEVGSVIGKAIGDAAAKDYVGAISKGVGKLTGKLRSVATGIGKEEGEKTKASKTAKSEVDKYNEIIAGANRRIESLKAERLAMGLTDKAAAQLKYETELLNQATQKGIDLSPEQRRQLGELAGTMANIEEETRKAKEAFDFAKSASSGFLDDMKNGLREGASLWGTFGNAVINVLNKILDKMINSGLELVFDGLKGSSGSSGFLGSVASAFGFGGSTQNFAKGGEFTNGIYSKPTMFQFANGGAFGQMGEAGPEAVMPLHRGSDGSLGVKMNGGGSSGTNIQVNVYGGDGNATVEQRETSQGVEIDVMLDDLVAQKLNEQGSSTNAAFRSQTQRSLIKR